MSVSNESIEFLKLRLQSHPDSFLFARFADYLLEKGEMDQAVEVCENGLKRHPYYVSAHFVMGKCYLKKKMFDQAEKEFKRVLFFDPKFLAAHKYYAEIMLHIGWENAIETSYRNILQIDPWDNEIRHKLNQLLLEKKQNSKQEEASQPFTETESEQISVKMEKWREAKNQVDAEPATDISTESTDKPNLQEPPPPTSAAKPQKQEMPKEAEPVRQKSSADLFEAVIEEEPPTAEEEEKFSYILDDIFREDDAVEDLAEQNIDDEFGFLEKDEDETKPALFESTISDSADDVPEIVFEDTDNSPIEKPSVSLPPRQDEPASFEQPTDEDAPEEQTPVRGVDQTEFVDEDNLIEAAMENIMTPKPPERASEPIPKSQTSVEETEIRETERSDATTMDTVENHSFRQTHNQGRDIRQVGVSGAKSKEEKIVTPTLGEIYAAQAQYGKAINVFEILRKKEPNNPAYIEKIKYLKRKLDESKID